jgi:hypothetical protein
MFMFLEEPSRVGNVTKTAQQHHMRVCSRACRGIKKISQWILSMEPGSSMTNEFILMSWIPQYKIFYPST